MFKYLNGEVYFNGKPIGMINDNNESRLIFPNKPIIPVACSGWPADWNKTAKIIPGEKTVPSEDFTCCEQEPLKMQVNVDMTDEILDVLQFVNNRIDENEKAIRDLEESKITKPSMSTELIDAERYIDDYNEIRKNFRVERFAKKQRIKSKLERIKKANEFMENNKKSPRPLIWSVILIVATVGAALALAL